jgi:endonuclease/exonuclease/phosphatase family metal-dependent hydrolase
MAKKKGNRLKTLGKFLLIVITILAAIGMLFSFLAKLLPPSFSSTVAYCGLFFPYLLLANFALTIIWLVVDFTWALLPALVILLNVNNIDRHFQFRGIEKPEVCANCLKVMSYNAKAFNIYRDDQMSLNRQFIHFLQNEKPDILCIQEYSYDGSGKSGFNSTDAIINALNVKDNEKTHKVMLPYRNKLGYQFGMAVFSKYRIVDGGFVETSDSSSNKSMYVDIRFNGDTLRIYNIHLTSMHLDSTDYETGKALWAGSYDSTFNNKAQMLSNKISAAYVARQKQAKAIREHISNCPYPVILCGDFNDSPASFSYNKIMHGLKDSFRNSGKGTGTTYIGGNFPAYRIDYIAHDKQYNDFQYTVCKDLTVSDHYPIYTYISIVKKD